MKVFDQGATQVVHDRWEQGVCFIPKQLSVYRMGYQSVDGRVVVWRNLGVRTFSARVDDVLIGAQFRNFENAVKQALRVIKTKGEHRP